jgi:hypothetical protein
MMYTKKALGLFFALSLLVPLTADARHNRRGPDGRFISANDRSTNRPLSSAALRTTRFARSVASPTAGVEAPKATLLLSRSDTRMTGYLGPVQFEATRLVRGSTDMARPGEAYNLHYPVAQVSYRTQKNGPNGVIKSRVKEQTFAVYGRLDSGFFGGKKPGVEVVADAPRGSRITLRDSAWGKGTVVRVTKRDRRLGNNVRITSLSTVEPIMDGDRQMVSTGRNGEQVPMWKAEKTTVLVPRGKPGRRPK